MKIFGTDPSRFLRVCTVLLPLDPDDLQLIPTILAKGGPQALKSAVEKRILLDREFINLGLSVEMEGVTSVPVSAPPPAPVAAVASPSSVSNEIRVMNMLRARISGVGTDRVASLVFLPEDAAAAALASLRYSGQVIIKGKTVYRVDEEGNPVVSRRNQTPAPRSFNEERASKDLNTFLKFGQEYTYDDIKKAVVHHTPWLRGKLRTLVKNGTLAYRVDGQRAGRENRIYCRYR